MGFFYSVWSDDVRVKKSWRKVKKICKVKNKNGYGCFVYPTQKAHLKKLYFYTKQQNVYLIAHCHESVCNFMWSRRHHKFWFAWKWEELTIFAREYNNNKRSSNTHTTVEFFSDLPFTEHGFSNFLLWLVKITLHLNLLSLFLWKAI